jgi:FtsZ-binding cell division protein ZapB
MKDEIKLKDMTDFLENVYKDIKKQPTLEEELEKERKFINKIKGNNEDEVKELLGHIEILDNTDYILHSDKAKALLNYITNLQKENEDLKESNHNWQRKLSNYKQRNEKSIELLEEYKYTEVDDYVKVIEFYKKIKKVLQGGDE